MSLTMNSTIIELSVHACNFVLKVLHREEPGARVWPKLMLKLHPKIAICQTFIIFTCLLALDNFTNLALYSFGGVNDQCGATSWAVQDPTGMLALLSCLCCHGDSDCNKIQIINFHLYIIQLW